MPSMTFIYVKMEQLLAENAVSEHKIKIDAYQTEQKKYSITKIIYSKQDYNIFVALYWFINCGKNKIISLHITEINSTKI